MRIAIVALLLVAASASADPDPRVAFLLERVAEERGVTLEKPPEVVAVTRAELGEVFRRQGAAHRDRVDRIIRVFMALGIFPEQSVQSLRASLLEEMTSGAAAIYDPTTRKILVTSDPRRDTHAFTIAHEFAHALQDQSHGLTAYMKPDAADLDVLAARRMVVEGEATLLGLLCTRFLCHPLSGFWEMLGDAGAERIPGTQRGLDSRIDELRRTFVDRKAAAARLRRGTDRKAYGSAFEDLARRFDALARLLRARNHLESARAATMWWDDWMSRLADGAAFGIDEVEVAYFAGAAFVMAVREAGGWSDVDALFTHPPESTEQVLHPVKRFGPRDRPTRLTLPDDARLLGPGWKPVGEERLGEAVLRQILATTLTVEEAVRASTGWDGDLVRIYGKEGGGRAAVWAQTYDSEHDAEQARGAWERFFAWSSTGIGAAVRASGKDVVVATGLAPKAAKVLAVGILAAIEHEVAEGDEGRSGTDAESSRTEEARAIGRLAARPGPWTATDDRHVHGPFDVSLKLAPDVWLAELGDSGRIRHRRAGSVLYVGRESSRGGSRKTTEAYVGAGAQLIGAREVEVDGRGAVDSRYRLPVPGGVMLHVRVLRVDEERWSLFLVHVGRRPPDEAVSGDVDAVFASFAVEKSGSSPLPGPRDRASRRRAFMEGMERIRLPENPTKSDVRSYLSRIGDVVQAAAVIYDDCLGRALRAVGPENIDVLLDVRSTPEGSTIWMEINEAIKALVGEEQRDFIIGGLARNQDLVDLVVERGWTEAARPILVRPVLRGGGWLSPAWLEAVASFRDTKTYEALEVALILADESSKVHDVLRKIPDLDLGVAADLLWRRNLDGTPRRPGESPRIAAYRRAHAARVAARHGCVDALAVLVAGLSRRSKGGRPDPVTQLDGIAEEVRTLLGDRGGEADLEKWFEEHRGRLAFDDTTGVYRVSEKDG